MFACLDRSDEAGCEYMEYIGEGDQPLSNTQAVSITSLLTVLGPIFGGTALLLFLLKLRKSTLRGNRFLISRELILQQIMHRRGLHRNANHRHTSMSHVSSRDEEIEIVPVHTMGLPVSMVSSPVHAGDSVSHMESTYI